MSHILLTGATGFIGKHLIPTLLKEGHQVTACTRNPENLNNQYAGKINTITVNFTDAVSPQYWYQYLKHIDVVINAVGIITETAHQKFDDIHTNAPVALFNACVDMCVKRIIQISALGAESSATTHYHQSKAAADDLLSSLPLDWFILKPSIIYGKGAKSMALFQAMSALPYVPLLNSGKQLIQPVDIDDVIDVILDCIITHEKDQNNKHLQRTINVVGGSVMSYSSFMQKTRCWLKTSSDRNFNRLIRLSVKLAQKLSHIGKWIGEPVLNPDTIGMLDQSKVYSSVDLEKLLARPLKTYHGYLLENPATQAQRWQSRLYFIRPVLRFVISFVWIWTALVSLLFYPKEQSFQLLEAVGISGKLLPISLCLAIAVDFIMGVWSLVAWRIRLLVLFQVVTILGYTIIISFSLPEFWLHPFAPILKNIPFLVLIYIWWVLEEESP